jgi:hypothetical protein
MSYVPSTMTQLDQRRQKKMLQNSRNLYKKGTFYTRKKVKSFVSMPSLHVKRATALYGVPIRPTRALAKASGCPLSVLRGIVKKGEGAYYSSGSRPNQTAQSWAYARLASALTGGKSAKIDFHLVKQCNPTKKAYQLARKRMSKFV